MTHYSAWIAFHAERRKYVTWRRNNKVDKSIARKRSARNTRGMIYENNEQYIYSSILSILVVKFIGVLVISNRAIRVFFFIGINNWNQIFKFLKNVEEMFIDMFLKLKRERTNRV